METALILLASVVVIVALKYAWPNLMERLKTKKVKITTVDKAGNKESTTLYLYQHDPLWDLVQYQKRYQSKSSG